MYMIYTTFSKEPARCWHPCIDETLARHLAMQGDLDAVIAVCKVLKNVTEYEYRVGDPRSDGWKWGTDIPTKELVRQRLQSAPKYDARQYNKRGRQRQAVNLLEVPLEEEKKEWPEAPPAASQEKNNC